jgi:crotonobetainyl-CoA:carnitine CoA-transferase CaiB-like acyl-CoA transferase
MKGPLEGLRVVEAGNLLVAAVAGQLLAHLGAEVIKIEPFVGDQSRGVRIWQNTILTCSSGNSIIFEMSNNNKKSMAFDIRKPEAEKILGSLIKKSDIFVTNIMESTLGEWGCRYDQLKAYNPRIVFGTGTGYGIRGPDSQTRSTDICGTGRGGSMFTSSPPDGSPTYHTGYMCDTTTGTMLAFGILAALRQRDKDGVSQKVVTSQLGAMMWLNSWNLAVYCNLGVEHAPFDRSKSSIVMLNIYKCQDNQWLALGTSAEIKYWSTFCKLLGKEELIDDPDFQTGEARSKNCEKLISILDKAFATKPRDEWLKLLKEKEFGCGPVNRISDLPTDPQVIANEYLINFDNGMKFCSFPFEIDGLSLPVNRHGAPAIVGQNTEEILADTCGYSWEDIGNLKEKGVIL